MSNHAYIEIHIGEATNEIPQYRPAHIRKDKDGADRLRSVASNVHLYLKGMNT